MYERAPQFLFGRITFSFAQKADETLNFYVGRKVERRSLIPTYQSQGQSGYFFYLIVIQKNLSEVRQQVIKEGKGAVSIKGFTPTEPLLIL